MKYLVYRYFGITICAGITIILVFISITLTKSQEYSVYYGLSDGDVSIEYNQETRAYMVDIPSINSWYDQYYSSAREDQFESTQPRIGIERELIPEGAKVYVVVQVDNTRLSWIQGIYKEYPISLEREYAILKAQVKNIDIQKDNALNKNIADETYTVSPTIRLEYGFENIPEDRLSDGHQLNSTNSSQGSFFKLLFSQGGELKLDSLYDNGQKVL